MQVPHDVPWKIIALISLDNMLKKEIGKSHFCLN